jgi:hypothetical protein
MKFVKQFLPLVVIILFFVSCQKGNDSTGSLESTTGANIPVLTTTDVTSITSFSAISGGQIFDSSEAVIINLGICYDTSPNPTINNNVVYATTSTANFTIMLSGLAEHTTYYIRSFATNSGGTGYGNELSFMPVIAVGQSYQGGTVIFVNNKGDHGIIAAFADLDTAQWGCSGTTISGADGTAIGTGFGNTDKITSQCPTAGIAARLCSDYVSGGYSDWFLPSYDELATLYLNRRLFNNLAAGIYWSSSQNNNSSAFCRSFSSTSTTVSLKTTYAHVRPVRAF